MRAQQAIVEGFFGEPIPRAFDLDIEPTRATMIAAASRSWHVTELPCWAVAMGTASKLLLLEPTAWKVEACDHARDTDADIDRVIAHELVHVFHGQHHPRDPEFDRRDAEGIGWFAEGLAVYASGQLDAKRLQQVAELVAHDGGPTRLVDAWSGPARYGVAGTLVRLVDQRMGRARLRELLAATTNDELLAGIGASEAELLADWRRSVASAP